MDRPLEAEGPVSDPRSVKWGQGISGEREAETRGGEFGVEMDCRREDLGCEQLVSSQD